MVSRPPSRRQAVARVSEPIAALRIDGLDQDGRGIARHDGKRILIHGALPGELVSANLFKRARRFYEARLTQVIEPSDQRVVPACAHFDVCGGCALQHLTNDAQVALKQRDVLDKLEDLADVSPQVITPPIVGPAWGYRRKARLGCKHVPGKGGVLVGFRERSSPFIADIMGCEVLAPQVGSRIAELRALLSSLDARDSVPQIEVAVGDPLTLLVLRNLVSIGPDDRARLAHFARQADLALALQPGGPDSVEALYPDPLPTLSYRLDEFGVTLEFEALDFVQVNAAINQKLVSAALAALGAAPGERVLDLFSGLGNFSIALAAMGSEVVALELGENMVSRARDNARLNGVHERVHAEVADLSDRDTIQRWLTPPPRRVLLDPPRSGAEEVVTALPERGELRVVYVSCNPDTMARDAATLVHGKGMRLTQLSVVDMFPHTSHVETLAVFDRP